MTRWIYICSSANSNRESSCTVILDCGIMRKIIYACFNRPNHIQFCCIGMHMWCFYISFVLNYTKETGGTIRMCTVPYNSRQISMQFNSTYSILTFSCEQEKSIPKFGWEYRAYFLFCRLAIVQGEYKCIQLSYISVYCIQHQVTWNIWNHPNS